MAESKRTVRVQDLATPTKYIMVEPDVAATLVAEKLAYTKAENLLETDIGVTIVDRQLRIGMRRCCVVRGPGPRFDVNTRR